MDRLNVLALFGGMAEEHDVSVKSVSQLETWFSPDRHKVSYVYITRCGAWLWGETPRAAMASDIRAEISPNRALPGLRLIEGGETRALPVDVAFPMLHGRYGEDGAVQGLLEMAGVPWVGCPVAASAMAMDKSLTYLAAESAGVAVPRHVALLPGDPISSGGIPYPLFVKPAGSGSSFGVSKVEGPEALQGAVALARRYGEKVLVEQAIQGREIGCAVLGEGENLTMGEPDEIALSGGFFRIHQEKSPEQGSENATVRAPARISAGERAAVLDAAARVYRALGCRGLARVDLFLGTDGRVTLNEVNTMPGFTRYSRYPRMMAAAGISMPEVVRRLIDLALARQESGQCAAKEQHAAKG